MFLERRSIKQLKKELASSPMDTLLTIVIISLFTWVVSKSIHWILFVADWEVITHNIPLYLFGSYPKEQLWRPLSWITILSALTIVTLIGGKKIARKKFLPLIWLSMIPIGIVFIAGGLGIYPVPSRYWGGITLTLLLTIFSAVLSLPIGIILAFGRRSELKFLRFISKTYIDVIRAMPLIAVLFFGQLLIPLFLPVGLEINRVLRAVFAFAIFTGAYVAEDIRGGLQAIPPTQQEAALALGLSSRQTLQIIILPQALMTALPALTNQAIGLLQNTSLMAILGLVELLGISRSLLANPSFIGKYLEVYSWLAIVYWIICTCMALLSRQIEQSLSTSSINNI